MTAEWLLVPLVAGCDPGAGEQAAGSGGTTSSPPGGTGGATVATAPATDARGGCVPGQMPGGGTLYGPYDARWITIDGQEYLLQVNEWNSTAAQTMAFGSSRCCATRASSCPGRRLLVPRAGYCNVDPV